jgi:hypothetical protein
MMDELELLKQAASELRSLRNQNQLMSARLEMFDSLMAVLHTNIATKSQGMSPDIVWAIEKFIDSKTPAKN